MEVKMLREKLTNIEKKQLIKDVLGNNHSAVGKNFPIFSKLYRWAWECE